MLMRIWTLHPKYLDARGLVALWREGLLAQAVLTGKTIGYVNHPQLARFRSQTSPAASIARYLRGVLEESVTRGYRFSAGKIGRTRGSGLIPATNGQIEYEWHHLMEKLRIRAPHWGARFIRIRHPEVHPLFRIVRGDVENWERFVDSRRAGRD
jgi:hypothetical protein